MLLFFDIDGTLWDYKNYIPDSTKAAIQKARKNGHLCFINSGRSRAYIKSPELLGIGFDGILSANGCRIEYRDRVIRNHLIRPVDAVQTLHSVYEHGLLPMLEGPNYVYINREDFIGDLFGEKVMEEMGDRLLSINDHWGSWEINKLSCGLPGRNPGKPFDPREIQKCYDELSALYDYILHGDFAVEMVPKGYGKGSGILKLCELTGTDVRDTFAFGDSANDREMMEKAGTAIAMGRSDEATKACAGFVTKNLEEDGIRFAMEHFGLI